MKPPKHSQVSAPKKGQLTIGDLIDLHQTDMRGMRKDTARSKMFVLRSLRQNLVHVAVEALTRATLLQLGILGKSEERDRRPTQEQLDPITAWLDGNPHQSIPAGRITRFAVASAMRIKEICRIR